VLSVGSSTAGNMEANFRLLYIKKMFIIKILFVSIYIFIGGSASLPQC
jgi:hypothetical protein